jgi:hypothetical protein
MSQSLRNPASGVFWLAASVAAITLGDAAITVLEWLQFNASLEVYGWAIGGPPYGGTRQRFVFCIAIAVLVAAVGAAALVLVTKARPGARLAVLYSLPACVFVSLFTFVYAPDNVWSSAKGALPAEAEAAAFDQLFPLWYTGGHAAALGLLAVLTARLLIVLLKPDVREFYEYHDPNALPVVPWARTPRRT